MTVQTKHFYAFGPFRLDSEKRVLVRDGTPVPLAPKAAEALLALDPVHSLGKELARTRLGPSTYVNWRVSPEGLRIAVASPDQLGEQVRIIDLRNGTERNLQLPHGWIVRSLSWTADGNAMFAAGMSTGISWRALSWTGKPACFSIEGGVCGSVCFARHPTVVTWHLPSGPPTSPSTSRPKPSILACGSPQIGRSDTSGA